MLMGLHLPFLATALLVAAPEPSPALEADADASEPKPKPAAENTRELFDKASTQYETSQYKESVATYTEAYQASRAIEDDGLRATVQAAIFFNLAQAHSKAYGLDESKDHLLKAVDLLEKYLAQTADLADKADAEALLEQAQAELDRLELLEQDEGATQGSLAPSLEQDEGETPRDKRGLRIGGFSLVGLGVAAGGLAVGGAALARQAEGQYAEGPSRAERDAALQKGSTANGLVLAGSISAGVCMGVGVALLIAARKRSKSTPTPSAWLSPTGAGVSIGGSF